MKVPPISCGFVIIIRFFFYLSLGISILTFSSIAQAESGWTDYSYIAELVPTSREYFEVNLPVKKNPSGCSNNTLFYQDYALNGSDKMFAVLLDGLKSGKQVRVYVTGKCNVNGYSEFNAVGIIP